MIIETEIIRYLQTALDTDRVYAEVPEDASGNFIVIDKTGGGSTDYINTATIAVQSYGSSKLRAIELNESVKTAMKDLIFFSDGISDCRLVTDYNFSNIAKKQHRYQAVFEITHYQEED